MRLSEILLSKNSSGADLQSVIDSKKDILKQQMCQYIDKISDPVISKSSRDFLKLKIEQGYKELKQLLEPAIAENENTETYEVYDTKTGKTVSGPYQTKARARLMRDKHDLKYGAVRYAVRPVGKNKPVLEAVHRVPISNDDFDLIKTLMEKPIPAVVAPIFISEIIDDDELFDQFKYLEDTDPNRDVRSMIAEWVKRVMPDQLHRFGQEVSTSTQKEGLLSPIHGYDPMQNRGTSSSITGNAYGRT